MKRRITSILALSMCALAATLFAGDEKKVQTASMAATGETAQIAGAVVDTKAPDFTLADLTGKTHSLSSFKGKTVVLEWTNYDCPFVKKFYGVNAMQKWQDAYIKKGVVWLSICSSAPGKEGHFATDVIKSRMTESKAMPTAYLVDADGKVGRMYGAKTTPHMFVINGEGMLVYAGAIDSKRSTNADDIAGAENYVASALDAIAAGKPVTTKTSTPYGCSVKYAQ